MLNNFNFVTKLAAGFYKHPKSLQQLPKLYRKLQQGSILTTMGKENEIGVVVVGLGIAGRVRVRDLQEKSCRLALRGVVSRRQVSMEGVTQLSLEDALDRSDVDAILICTEPAPHEEYVRRALDKGKHVLVEYPVALTASKAKELFQLAEDKGLVLYEENIAMLTDGYLTVKEKAKTVDLRQATYSLSGSYNGWLEDFKGSGLPFVSGVSGIQVMLSLFGDLVVKGGKLERTENSFTARASLETEKGGPISLTLTRSGGEHVKRIKEAVYEFEDGELLEPSKVAQKSSKPGLFMKDMEIFDLVLEAGKLPEYNKWLSLRSLEIAEQIHSFF
ncbi:Biliverdin reductase a [Plakobranchus ocellatus]|uniref:Biliverdin reductase a n=1 Tax=Plakobranchus ocellatus TaxID=259542 RepID=A0AAV4BT38_9GAST|nr:Biliverdin reductase a [Plakobranchus ocellatus]